MANPNNHPSSLFFFVTNKLNSFCLLKTLIIIFGMLEAFLQVEMNTIAAVSKNLNTSLPLFVAPHVADDNNILAINNFDGNYFNRNQIKFDTLQRRAHDTNDNDLLSQSIENCSRTNNFARRTCGTDATILTTHSSDSDRSRTNPANRDTMTNRFSNVNKSLAPSLSSSSLLLQQHLQQQQQHLLSRPKRYLSFPEGSSFSVAVCFTVGIIGNPRYNYMSFGLNWGVAYDLPNTTWILNHLHGFAKRPIPVAVWHRRSRRSLYKEIENVVDNMGYNGRDCILRALCESRQYFQRTKMGMIGEMLRAVFSLPKQRIFTRELAENYDIELYDKAYRKARSIADCSEHYKCGFSLLELAFGKYSTPPEGYYAKH